MNHHKTKKYIVKALSTAIAHSYHSLDYEQNASGIMHIYKDMLHLKSFKMFSDNIPEEYTPTHQDLHLVELSLNGVLTDVMRDENVYKIDYYIGLSHLHRWRSQCYEFAEAAKEQLVQASKSCGWRLSY